MLVKHKIFTAKMNDNRENTQEDNKSTFYIEIKLQKSCLKSPLINFWQMVNSKLFWTELWVNHDDRQLFLMCE